MSHAGDEICNIVIAGKHGELFWQPLTSRENHFLISQVSLCFVKTGGELNLVPGYCLSSFLHQYIPNQPCFSSQRLTNESGHNVVFLTFIKRTFPLPQQATSITVSGGFIIPMCCHGLLHLARQLGQTITYLSTGHISGGVVVPVLEVVIRQSSWQQLLYCL